MDWAIWVILCYCVYSFVMGLFMFWKRAEAQGQYNAMIGHLDNAASQLERMVKMVEEEIAKEVRG